MQQPVVEMLVQEIRLPSAKPNQIADLSLPYLPRTVCSEIATFELCSLR
ncbi:MAG: hypothetical protein LW709_06320 [Oxalobacteraceae bacterium]|nr:hypothetical protein [Oxalobacteraceae bacterium]